MEDRNILRFYYKSSNNVSDGQQTWRRSLSCHLAPELSYRNLWSNCYTLTFPDPGTYRVEIAGTFPQIEFGGGANPKIIDVGQWGNIAWRSMRVAFKDCINLNFSATDTPDLSGVTDMYRMMKGTTVFNSDIDDWDVSTVTNMSELFMHARAFNQTLDNWDTSHVTNMNRVFYDADDFNRDVSMWDVSSTTDMSEMFSHSIAYNQPLDGWDTSSVTNMSGMFDHTDAFNQPLNSWNVSNVTDMSNMFYDAPAFDQSLDNWDVSNVTTMDGMFEVVTVISQANLDATLVSWAAQSVQSNVPFNLGLKTYSSVGVTALATLAGTYNWDVTEEYLATYDVGAHAILSGTASQRVASGTVTESVTVTPDDGYSFIDWSDGVATTSRTDTITDNLSVTANIESNVTESSSDGSSAGSSSRGGSATRLTNNPSSHTTNLTTVSIPDPVLTPVSTSPVITTTTFTRDLTLQTEGEDVRILQQFLMAKDFFLTGKDTGYFGLLTYQALVQYQQAMGIVPASGYSDPSLVRQ